MSATLRAVAVASCTALLVAGVVTSADATSARSSAKPVFFVSPEYGPPGTTVTFKGAVFTGDIDATINGVSMDDFVVVSPHRATAIVPSEATTGPLATTNGTTTKKGPIFTVQQATTGTASLSKRQIRFTHTLVVSGVDTAVGTGAAAAGQPAQLQHLAAGSTQWRNDHQVPIKKTNSHGQVSWTVKPYANGRFRIHFGKTHAYGPATTKSHGMRVLPLVNVEPIHTVPELSSSSISGSVRPHLSGRVLLQQRVNGAWKTVRRTTAESGRYSFDISPSSVGRLTYRIGRPHDSTHAGTTSRTLRVQVVHRTLSIGDTGPDVLALQKRLRTLHYDVGPVNGDYGDDTLHAVTAFEKVQGITADGETGVHVWSALNHPKTIQLRYPTAGTYVVEVDIAKQVLLLGKDGKVAKILDTSTAGGYLYTNSEGGTSRAITPTGHFTIQYKLTGWHKSKLGELYYPSYFTNTGYAIHGEGNGNDGGEVPPYPASHGCVRITNDAVLRYYSTPWLAVGTSVWIYG